VPIAAMITANARRKLFEKITEAVANGAQIIYGGFNFCFLHNLLK
jgi:hypothetical protein